MRRDSTTYAAQAAGSSGPGAPARALPFPVSARALARLGLAMLAGALLIALAYQLPVTHTIDIGGYDSAYVQGFADPLRDTAAQPRPELAGSDGSARPMHASSYLLLPQAGLPAQLTLRARAPNDTPRDVVVLLNSTHELGRFQAGPAWQEHTFTLGGGLLKPNDVVIELRTNGPQPEGVLLDRAEFHAGPAPIVPYPPQLLYGALAAGMLWLLLAYDRKTTGALHPSSFTLHPSAWLAGIAGMAIAFLLLYRAQLAYPYPLLRLLPALCALLGALLALRYAPALHARLPALPDALALGGLGAWASALLLAGQRHVTLSVPGAENDFRVFALRSAHLAGQFPAGTTDPARDGVLRADGFYNLGYPLLLWLARPFASDNPFLAARLVAVLSAALLLLAGWLLARRLLDRGAALLALLLLALSPLVVQYGLYLGTDMPFAALCALAIALLVPPAGRYSFARHAAWAALAGATAGAAFLVRHPGLLLLPFGWLAIWNGSRFLNPGLEPTNEQELNTQNSTLKTRALAIFTLAFALVIIPQLDVNIRDTGQPLYSQQAKNVWQAVFGAGDWGRWAETRNDVGIAQVIAQDPGRFMQNWWNNLRGFFGTGGEDTREFGQALQLRLLSFPANWLAVGGLLGWALYEGKRQKEKGKSIFSFLPFTLLIIWGILYVAAISVGLPLQGRFVLPLAPIYAIGAAWAVLRVAGPARLLLAGLVLLALLWGGFNAGAEYVLRPQPDPTTPGQPAAELAIITSLQARLRPGDSLIVRADPRAPLGKYSAIAHLARPAPSSDSPAALRASGATYLIWSSALGPAPELGPPLDSAGTYQLYRLQP